MPILYRRMPDERATDFSNQDNALKPLIDEAASFGRKHDVKLVWAVMYGPSMVCMARRVAENLKASLICLFWDPVEYTCRELGLDADSTRSVVHELSLTMKMASSSLVPSPGWKAEYELRYDARAVQVLNPLIEEGWHPIREDLVNERELRIGFAGSMYAKTEFEALISFLNSVDWQLAGRDISLRVLGNFFTVPMMFGHSKARIEFLGFRDSDDTHRLLAESDLGYLPYWFDDTYEQSVRVCFPSKLSTYLSAGCPIFFHGPEDSSVTKFMEKYLVGERCHSLSFQDIERNLMSFLDVSKRKLWKSGQSEAIEKDFHEGELRRRFASFLGCSQTALIG